MSTAVHPPAPGLRIAVADDEANTRRFFEEVLAALGHQVVALARTGRQLVECCRDARPDLVITDVRMPDMDGIEAAEQVNAEWEVPVILVSAHTDGGLLARALQDHVMAYLVKPVEAADLRAAIPLAMMRYRHYREARAEADSLKQALEDRKVIEHAKGVVMHRLRLDEPEAYVRMRRLASHGNEKLVNLARRVVGAEQLFRALEDAGPPAGRRG